MTELRYGALRAGWGELRRRQLERSLADVDVIQTSAALIDRCASLRAEQSRVGHALAQKIHEADRWFAATAVALGLELVAGDGIFENIAGLDVLRIRRRAENQIRRQLPGGAGEESGHDTGGVPVEGHASPVVAHRGPGIGVTCRFLHVSERDAGVEGRGDEGVAERVRPDPAC